MRTIFLAHIYNHLQAVLLELAMYCTRELNADLILGTTLTSLILMGVTAV